MIVNVKAVSLPGYGLFSAFFSYICQQFWNAAESARSLGIGETSVRRYALSE